MPFYTPGGGPVKLASGHSNGQGSYYSVWYDRLHTSYATDQTNTYAVLDGDATMWRHANGIVDIYTDSESPDTVVTWMYNFGGSVFATRSSEDGNPIECTLGIAVAYYLSPGTIRMYANGAVGQLYLQVDGGPFSPITLVQDNQGTRYDITGLSQGTHQIQLKDSSTPACYASRSADVTVGVPPALCLLAISDVHTMPPTAIGATDGTVEGIVSGTQGSAVLVELWQDGTSIYSLNLLNSDLVRSDYRFKFIGVASGLYSLSAKTNSACVFPRSGANSLDVTVLPPDLRIGDQLTFLPWVQSALLNGIPAQTAQSTSLRPTLNLKATLAVDASTQNTLTVAATTAEIYGPGDVLGLNQRAILTTVPQPGAVGFSPLQLAAIDFKEEDLPWRYSMLTAPAVAATTTTAALATAPLPWCLLLVLEASEYDPQPLAGKPLPSIKVKARATTPGVPPLPLPYPSRDAHQQKLWAHVQINASLGSAEINDFLNVTLPRNPDFAYSRVLCPRRLRQNMAYHAFLVPAIEAGRLAGLGREFDAAHVQKSSIPEDTAEERLFPVYFQWQFTTGTEEDFESLVTELHSANARTSAATAPTLSVRTAASTYALPMPALLVDAAAASPPATLAAEQLGVAQYLHAELIPGRVVGGRPVVTPPLYGRAYLVSTVLLPKNWTV